MFKPLRHIFLFCFISLISLQLSAQSINESIDSLNNKALLIHTDTTLQGRLVADSLFTKQLITLLRQFKSFSFDFSKMNAIKVIESPDHSFKIFTWHIELADGTYRQRGAIQINTGEHPLHLIPLFDQSDFTLTPERGLQDAKHWCGAVYYEIIPMQLNGQQVYTLLGYDEYTKGITRKIIEVMHFENGQPVFGGDNFRYPKDPTYPLMPCDRWVMQYKKGSNATIRWIAEQNSIEVSELTSTTNDWKDPSTWVPTGLFMIFQWKEGRWVMNPNKN